MLYSHLWLQLQFQVCLYQVLENYILAYAPINSDRILCPRCRKTWHARHHILQCGCALLRFCHNFHFAYNPKVYWWSCVWRRFSFLCLLCPLHDLCQLLMACSFFKQQLSSFQFCIKAGFVEEHNTVMLKFHLNFNPLL